MKRLENLVRIGEVRSVDEETRTARVLFADKEELLSGPLKVITILSSGTAYDTDLTYRVMPADHPHDGISEQHSHEVGVENDFPEVGDFVLCLFLPNGNGAGFILGVI